MRRNNVKMRVFAAIGRIHRAGLETIPGHGSLAKNLCQQCHIAVKAKDYILTGCPPR
jgi:hypothetical protein